MRAMPTMNMTHWTLAAVVVFTAACGGRAVEDVGPGQGSGGSTTTGSGSGSGMWVGSGTGTSTGSDSSCPGVPPRCPWCNGTTSAECTSSGWECPPPPPCVEEPPDTGPPDEGPPDAAAERLCTQTGGTVVQTYCSANPPFAQFTCASGINDGICDPVSGQTATTPECVCVSPGSDPPCFDPVRGCVASGSGSGPDTGSPETGPPDTGPIETGPPDTGPPDEGPPDEGPPDAAGETAELCTRTGGTVVQTFCSANPPFAQYTCASGENGALCDSAPGQTTPTTPECVCPNSGSTSQCFDPVNGCVASM
jgi:hypothetical protein